MDEIKVVINGVKYRVVPDEVENVKDDERAKTGYERVKKTEIYYFIGMTGDVDFDNEADHPIDCSRYEIANYYSDETTAENNARADKLICRLRQWQALNDEPVDWMNDKKRKWGITYDYSRSLIISCGACDYRNFTDIYFSTKEKAEEAIEVFKDDLIWYFTEYISRLDEPRIG